MMKYTSTSTRPVVKEVIMYTPISIRPIVKEVIMSRHVIMWRYLLTLLPFKQLNEKALTYIYYKALSFGKNVRIKNFSFSFLLIILSVFI